MTFKIIFGVLTYRDISRVLRTMVERKIKYKIHKMFRLNWPITYELNAFFYFKRFQSIKIKVMFFFHYLSFYLGHRVTWT